MAKWGFNKRQILTLLLLLAPAINEGKKKPDNWSEANFCG